MSLHAWVDPRSYLEFKRRTEIQYSAMLEVVFWNEGNWCHRVTPVYRTSSFFMDLHHYLQRTFTFVETHCVRVNPEFGEVTYQNLVYSLFQ